MKKVAFLCLAFLALTTNLFAGDKKKKEAAAAGAVAVDSAHIKWLSLDELEVAMRKQPRKVFIDIYTDWCGWCKVMDKKTFSNKDVIKYMNANFYAVKFNAERKDSIRFMGRWYGFKPENRANELAIQLLRGQMSYPTSVILEENFQNPQPIPGYLDVPTIEKILKYLAENHYKNTNFEDYSKTFTPSWTAASPLQESDFRGGH